MTSSHLKDLPSNTDSMTFNKVQSCSLIMILVAHKLRHPMMLLIVYIPHLSHTIWFCILDWKLVWFSVRIFGTQCGKRFLHENMFTVMYQGFIEWKSYSQSHIEIKHTNMHILWTKLNKLCLPDCSYNNAHSTKRIYCT